MEKINNRKIVVLDGFALNPGDMNWDALASLGELKVYDRTPAELILKRAQGAAILLTNKTPLTRKTLSRLPDLGYVGVLATGYNIVDVDAARELGITVTNAPAYSTDSVSQLVFALLLELCHHVAAHSAAVHEGQWVESKDFCFWNSPLMELRGKTMGIIGFGKIGSRVANLASAFGMDVIVNSHNRRSLENWDYRWEELDVLLAESDVVSLHCPLLPSTRNMINQETLAKMKNTAFLINTSRGPMVQESDLAYALNNGLIAGAGVDVLSEEPPTADNPLLTAKNCIITPHIAWATREARIRLMSIIAANLEAYLLGKPVNVVN